MNTSRKWAAACCAISLLPLLVSTVLLLILQPVILATYNFAYGGKPVPPTISGFVANPVVICILSAIPFVASGILLIRRRLTMETTVLLALGNLAYTMILLVCYAAAGVGIILAWNIMN